MEPERPLIRQIGLIGTQVGHVDRRDGHGQTIGLEALAVDRLAGTCALRLHGQPLTLEQQRIAGAVEGLEAGEPDLGTRR